jgi:hypothetical protein
MNRCLLEKALLKFARLHLITIPLSYTKPSDRASLRYGRLLNPPGLFDGTRLHTGTLTEMYISDPESTTALSPSKWSFPHSALLPLYPDLQCETLYIDASLRSVTSNFHSRYATHHWSTSGNIAYPGVAQKQIHMYTTDAPVPSQEPGRYPTAYFRCQSNITPGSSRQHEKLSLHLMIPGRNAHSVTRGPGCLSRHGQTGDLGVFEHRRLVRLSLPRLYLDRSKT